MRRALDEEARLGGHRTRRAPPSRPDEEATEQGGHRQEGPMRRPLNEEGTAKEGPMRRPPIEEGTAKKAR
jgi:hypothetical protein